MKSKNCQKVQAPHASACNYIIKSNWRAHRQLHSAAKTHCSFLDKSLQLSPSDIVRSLTFDGGAKTLFSATIWLFAGARKKFPRANVCNFSTQSVSRSTALINSASRRRFCCWLLASRHERERERALEKNASIHHHRGFEESDCDLALRVRWFPRFCLSFLYFLTANV